MDIKTIFELIMPFNHNIIVNVYSILNTYFQKAILTQSPQFESKALLDEKMTPSLDMYEWS